MTDTTRLSPQEEVLFRKWYEKIASSVGLDPDPDNPLHKYDYRGAWKARSGPSKKAESHWISDYKSDDHPNRYVGGVDTKHGVPQGSPPMMRNPDYPGNPIYDLVNMISRIIK